MSVDLMARAAGAAALRGACPTRPLTDEPRSWTGPPSGGDRPESGGLQLARAALCRAPAQLRPHAPHFSSRPSPEATPTPHEDDDDDNDWLRFGVKHHRGRNDGGDDDEDVDEDVDIL